MSRGLGSVQRGILAALEENKMMNVIELAWFIFDAQADANGKFNITDAQRASVARALAGLQRQGLAFPTYRNARGWQWCLRNNAVAYVERLTHVFGNAAANDLPKPLLEAWAKS